MKKINAEIAELEAKRSDILGKMKDLDAKEKEIATKTKQLNDLNGIVVSKKSSVELREIEVNAAKEDIKSLEKSLLVKFDSVASLQKDMDSNKIKLDKELSDAKEAKDAWIVRKTEVDERDRIVGLLKAGIKKQQEDIAVKETSLKIAKLRMTKEIHDNNLRKTLADFGA